MTLNQFGRIIRRHLVVECVGKFWRCYYENVAYTDKPGRCGITVTIAGAGPTQERMRQDFAQKIRGKIVRLYDGMGAYDEYPVPLSLTA